MRRALRAFFNTKVTFSGFRHSFVWCVLFAFGGGCGTEQSAARPYCGEQCAGTGAQAGSSSGGASGAGGTSGSGGGPFYNGPSPQSCSSHEPPWLNGEDNTKLCSANVAQTLFRYALCSCEALSFAGSFESDAFLGAEGNYSSSVFQSGSVGVNGTVTYAGTLTVGGSLLIANNNQENTALMCSNLASVRGDLKAQGDVAGGELFVHHNAFVAGSVSATPVEIDGTLTIPSGENVVEPNQISGIEYAPVNVPSPCDCGSENLPDLLSFTSDAPSNNDNQIIDLDPAALVSHADAVTLTLPCGRYYLSKIAGNGHLHLRIAGRTALFVGGDFLGNGLEVELGPEGELDLFVAGKFSPGYPLKLGSIEHPAKLRVFITGQAAVELTGVDLLLAGNIYAPKSIVSLAGGLDVYGAIFAQFVAFAGDAKIHYDASILQAGDVCPKPTGCSTCNDCANQACINGVCGDCTQDSDCCAPLVCNDGFCGILIE